MTAERNELETTKEIINVKVITPLEVIENGFVRFQNGKIRVVGEMSSYEEMKSATILDGQGLVVCPGWIDAHTHGGNGSDYMDCTLQDIEAILQWLASNGVTGVLPTIASFPVEEQIEIIQKINRVQQQQPRGAAILGIHLEGPYLNQERRGAQPSDFIRYPSINEIKKLLAAGNQQIRLVTLAPELPGALDLVHYLTEQNVVVSCGHSEATLEQFNDAIEAGLNRVAHSFNGMPPLHHRKPGIMGGALYSDDVYCELILDGVHVHPLIASLMVRLKGSEKVVLITDATQAAGLTDGVYIRPGNRKIIVKNGEARLESGSLAGSVLTMQQAVKNVVNLMHLPLETAVQMCSLSAAKSLGLADHKGSIEVGKDADLLLIEEDASVVLTLVRGEVVYQSKDSYQDLRFRAA